MSDRRTLTVNPAPSGEKVDPPAAEALVAFHDIWRYWGRGRKRWAVLRGVNLQVAAGTAVCIQGGNGAGKTTLLRIATAILAPDRGSVTIDGISSEGSWREYHRQIGFLSAGDRGLYARFSVRGHLNYAARLAFIPRGQRTPAVEAALSNFGLEELGDRRADRLSQGQRQRLRLALAFVHDPKVVLLDEPRNSLDSDGLAMLKAAVETVLNAGGAVIWCSPLGEVQPVEFDHMYVIDGGILKAA